MTPATNLAVQSAVIANAAGSSAPTVAWRIWDRSTACRRSGSTRDDEELVPAHLEVSRRLSRRLNAPLVTLDVREIELVERLFDSIPTPSLA